MSTIRVLYERDGHCLWHDCARGGSAMRVEREDFTNKRSLVRCVKCFAAGWLPYGSFGTTEVPRVLDDSDYLGGAIDALLEEERKEQAMNTEWKNVVSWLRNNYQDHTTIADLCNAMLAAAPSQPAAQPEPCMCKDRPKSECPGEWEPGCDLGANEKHAKAAQPEQPAPTKCRHCGSTTLAGCNSMGCFAAESEQPEPGGLTDARISALWDESRSTDAGAYAAIRAFARAIEREVLATTRKRTAEQNATELDALRARCEAAEALLRRYLEQRAREQHVMRHGSNSDQEVVRNFYRETRLPDDIDAHLKGPPT